MCRGFALLVLVTLLPGWALAQCDQFIGSWAGTWSQGQYGTHRLHVTHVSDQCIATLTYDFTEVPSGVVYQVPIRAGVMSFACNLPGGSCRLEVRDDVLSFTYRDPSGFENRGTFRRQR